MAKYICTKSWARTRKGNTVFGWELKKFPIEIQRENFKLFAEPAIAESNVTTDAKVAEVIASVSEAKKEDPSWNPDVSPAPKRTTFTKK